MRSDHPVIALESSTWQQCWTPLRLPDFWAVMINMSGIDASEKNHHARPACKGRAAPNFQRHTYTILGLPIDAVSLIEAAAIIEDSIRERTRCFISTPNANFTIASRRDQSFRRSVLQSDLVLADGQPIVWAGKLLGTPIHGRVPGSGLFEYLIEHASLPIKVYFFGGPEGAAQAAHESINKMPGLVKSVGYCSPGFVSVSAMSAQDFIDEINSAAPDFLVVALGAKKGQEWIVANLDRLQVPVISHLGAVVNFTAGTVQRAPGWVQKIAAEWLWRIFQEPQLWRRYWGDGVQLLKWFVLDLLPTAIASRCRIQRGRSPAQLSTSSLDSDAACLTMAGDWREADAKLLSDALLPIIGNVNTVQVDARDLLEISPRIHAMLLQCEGAGVTWRFTNARKRVERFLASSGCSHWVSR